VPLTINGGMVEPTPAAEMLAKDVGLAGSGNSHCRPRYWTLLLLITVCGLKFWLSTLPFGKAQLASACVSGVAAAVGAFGAALTGAMRIDAPIPDTRKRRLIAIARIDVLLNVFFILFVISLVKFFVNTFVISRVF
jgi:hypothetical protein